MNKKGFTSSLRAIILLLVTFVVLLFLFPAIFEGINKDKGYEGCRTQITMAAKEKPIAFDACHEYQLIFGEKSAEKFDLFDDNKKVDEYNYETLLKKYEHNYNKKVKTDERLEFATYLILAEEFKLNDYIYYAPNISIKRLGTKYAGTVCKPATLITFEQNVFQGAKFNRFSGFLGETVFDLDSKNQLSYSEYLAERYESDLDKVSEMVFDSDNFDSDFAKKHPDISLAINMVGIASTGAITGSAVGGSLGTIVPVIGNAIGLVVGGIAGAATAVTIHLVKGTEKVEIMGPDSYNDLGIDTTKTYDLIFFYHTDSSRKDYLLPFFINLIPYDQEPLACSSYLGVG